MLINRILKSNFTKLPKYSYGRFIFQNPKSAKKDRIKALKQFLNKTR